MQKAREVQRKYRQSKVNSDSVFLSFSFKESQLVRCVTQYGCFTWKVYQLRRIGAAQNKAANATMECDAGGYAKSMYLQEGPVSNGMFVFILTLLGCFIQQICNHRFSVQQGVSEGKFLIEAHLDKKKSIELDVRVVQYAIRSWLELFSLNFIV